MLVPSDGLALRQVVESGYDLGDAVVWLDDLERFLTPGGLDLALLQRLCPAESSVAVVATIRDNELAAYTLTGDRSGHHGLCPKGLFTQSVKSWVE